MSTAAWNGRAVSNLRDMSSSSNGGTSARTNSLGGDPSEGSTFEDMLGLELQFENLYVLMKRLRSGSYGTVYITRHVVSNEEYAVKIIDRKKLKKKSDDDGVFREVAVLRELSDIPGIVRLIDFFVSQEQFHMVQIYAKGGDVFDRLAKRTTYTEADARALTKSLLQTLNAMHRRGYVHRDLKPENLLLQHTMSDTCILLADFGFARKIPPGKNGALKTRCGTPAFVAPEILVGSPYRQTVDMWSMGVLLFLLLGGYPPFQDESHKGLFRKIRASDFIFHELYWGNISIEAKQLISQVLVVNPKHRWTAQDCLQKSSWIKRDEKTLKNRDISTSLGEIKKFNAKMRLKSAMMAIHWMAGAKFWEADKTTFSQWDKDDVTAVTGGGGSGGGGGGGGGGAGAGNHSQGGQTSHSIRSRPPPGFRDIYDLQVKIRKGSFATVWECRHRETEETYAVKIIKREGLKASDDEAVMNEVAIMQSLVHRHICQLVDFYEEKDYFFLVMDYMTGGDVFDRIVERTVYTEKDAREMVAILLKTVNFMHVQGVAHRDLKPQNLLLTSKDNDSDIKIADFGFARRVHTPQSLTTRCGTPTYVAPEILKNIPHDCAADMWSVGVIIYVLLVGYPPFMEDNQQELFRKIRSGSYTFPAEDWKSISDEAKNLIRKLLVVDPMQRLTAAEALRSSWISLDGDSLSSTALTDSLHKMKEKRHRLRGLARAVMWMSQNNPVPANTVITAMTEPVATISEMHDEDEMTAATAANSGTRMTSSSM